jgi:phospholipid/cholesterol/gamma-HCH transport system substrate-binding protein
MTKPTSTRVATLLGVAVLLGMVGAYVFAYNAQNGMPWRDYNFVTVAFEETNGLRRGGDVRIDGVRVGQVRDTFYEDGEARARLQLPGDLAVYNDATAEVRNRSALGQKLVELDPGTPEAGELEGVLPLEQTAASIELDEVLDALDPETRDALQTTLRSTGQGLAGRQEDLQAVLSNAPDLLDDLGTTAQVLVDPETDLPGLLQQADLLASRFSGREDELERLVAQLDTTVAALATEGGGPLADTLDLAPDTLSEVRPVLDQLVPVLADADLAVAQLRPGLEALGAATPDLRGTLREALEPLDRLTAVSPDAVVAVDALGALVVDARPLAPAVRRALGSGQAPLAALAPYAPEVALWFTYAQSATDDGDQNGNWLRIIPVLGLDNISGVLPIPNPLTNRTAYPAPGQSGGERAVLDNLGER